MVLVVVQWEGTAQWALEVVSLWAKTFDLTSWWITKHPFLEGTSR